MYNQQSLLSFWECNSRNIKTGQTTALVVNLNLPNKTPFIRNYEFKLTYGQILNFDEKAI